MATAAILNYETISAVNGQDALDKVDSEKPDLVLLDIMMPIMDGFEALKYLKANPASRDIPVIVISANSDLDGIVKCIQLGAEDYLPKPFEPTLLHARISSGLDKKRLRDLEQLYLKSLEREMEIGHEIQKNFLPSALPSVDGWEIASYFQAARNVACIAHLVTGDDNTTESPTRFGFVVIAPKAKIAQGVFSTVDKDDIARVVERRAKCFDPDAVKWCEGVFRRILGRCELAVLSWEDVLGEIGRVDPDAGTKLGEFYSECLRYNPLLPRGAAV